MQLHQSQVRWPEEQTECGSCGLALRIGDPLLWSDAGNDYCSARCAADAEPSHPLIPSVERHPR
jgi:hypothetical protein